MEDIQVVVDSPVEEDKAGVHMVAAEVDNLLVQDRAAGLDRVASAAEAESLSHQRCLLLVLKERKKEKNDYPPLVLLHGNT